MFAALVRMIDATRLEQTARLEVAFPYRTSTGHVSSPRVWLTSTLVSLGEL